MMLGVLSPKLFLKLLSKANLGTCFSLCIKSFHTRNGLRERLKKVVDSEQMTSATEGVPPSRKIGEELLPLLINKGCEP